MAPTRATPGASRGGLAEERRSSILEAAEQLVAVHGFDALRLRDVSSRAGVSIGLIQHYFDTRDELLFEAMRAASRRRAREWLGPAAGATNASRRLTTLLEGAIDDRHRCVVWLETCAAATRHPDLRDDVRATQDAWRHALRTTIGEGVSTGEFSPTLPAEDVVVLLVSLIDGLMLATATEDGDDASQAERVRLLRETARRVLRTSDGQRKA